MTLASGSRLGPYEISGALGAGGMGQVYRARDTSLGRDVAIKVLPAEFAKDADRVSRFRREAQILATLNHPNIAGIYGLQETESGLALAMECVDGEDLQARLKRGALPLDEALAIARQIADALAEAHDHGIVHRDLKPANVKVTPDGKVKVLDFGLAKAFEGDGAGGSSSGSALLDSPTMTKQGTEAGLILGTAAYMSPEQARGRKVDKRTDIWAFGVLVFEMLSGKRLFGGETASDTIASVLRQDVDWNALPKPTPPSVVRVLKRCLERDLAQRLRDVGDARFELVESALRESAAPLGGRSTARLAAAMGLAAVLGGGFAWFLRGEGRPALEARYLTASGHDRLPSVSPDGASVAFVSDRDGKSRIWIKQIATGVELPLTSGPLDDQPQYSPDGSTVLFTRRAVGRSAVFRVPSVGGEPRRVIDLAGDASWSPDGRRIAFVRFEPAIPPQPAAATLFVATNDGGDARTVRSFGGQSLFGPRWSPDGRRIAVLSATGGSATFGIKVVDVENGTDRTVSSSGSGVTTRPISLAWESDSDLVYASGELAGGTVNGAGGRLVRVRIETGASTLVYSSPDALEGVNILGADRYLASTQTVRENVTEWTGSAARRLTRGRAADRQPAYSPDGRTLVFSSDRSGNLDLWSVDLATLDLRQITDDAAGDWDPAFSTDGRLWWSSSRTGVFEVWTSESDGSASRQASRDGVDAENPSLSRDRKTLVYGSSRPNEIGIWRARPDGSEAAALVKGTVGLPEVSPDGRYVLFLSFSSIASGVIDVVRLEDGAPAGFRIPVPLQRITTSNLGRARWMPDGRRIAFLGQDERGANGIFVQDFVPGRDTSATRRKLAGFDLEVEAESFGISADGSRVAIAAREIVSSLIVLDRVRR